MTEETVQIPFRCPPELVDRFNRSLSALRPQPSRNALLVFLVERWVEEQEIPSKDRFAQ